MNKNITNALRGLALFLILSCYGLNESWKKEWIDGISRNVCLGIALPSLAVGSTGHKATALVEGKGRLVPVEHHAAADKAACGTGYPIWYDDYSRAHDKQHGSRMVEVDVV